MLLPILLAQAAPRDLTPPNAYALRHQRGANGIAADNGVDRLTHHLLPAGDIEVRYWGGFAWGTKGLLMRLHKGKWSAMRLEAGRHARPTPLPAPKLGWPTFWAKAEKLNLFTLPDQEQAGSKKGYHKIFDGYSTFVEFQRDGTYRAYAYSNPLFQKTWPSAKPMAALDRFVTSQFPR